MNQIEEIERQIGELMQKLVDLRKGTRGAEVPSCNFATLDGGTSLMAAPMYSTERGPHRPRR